MAALSLSELNARGAIRSRDPGASPAALRTIKSKIKREGRVKLSTLSAATLTRIANDYLRSHPELLAEAAADPIVQNL